MLQTVITPPLKEELAPDHGIDYDTLFDQSYADMMAGRVVSHEEVFAGLCKIIEEAKTKARHCERSEAIQN